MRQDRWADCHGTPHHPSRGAIAGGTIAGLASPTGLAITPDGSRVYAALSGSNEIAKIDAATLAVTRQIDLSAYPSPTNLSLDGDRLWVGYGVKGSCAGGILSLDLSAAASAPVQVADRMYGAPPAAGAGTTVATGESGLSPSNLRAYDVSTTPATLRGIINGSANGLWDLNDLTITPDGAHAITVFPGSGLDVWDTTTLTKVRTYGSRSEYPGAPRSVARSADGAHHAAAFDNVAAEGARLVAADDQPAVDHHVHHRVQRAPLLVRPALSVPGQVVEHLGALETPGGGRRGRVVPEAFDEGDQVSRSVPCSVVSGSRSAG
ncbi:YncE family protein [Micromonospora avicenniae]|uniref:40-residue YVTN family beta-propeller repeat-containing protein n=1 Tax=Micromonospora avicenniae TaxID=1198245 RepID=A0A1N7FA70_9ACTN|nr:hypothetical protein [Micromonospora avicenniae]SIR97162.1 40-residue YVTN family beta-propeller repeat-containing protein [Micromonospora avicenniae]